MNTRTSNKSKHPGIPDLPASQQAKMGIEKDGDEGTRTKATAAKKPIVRKVTQAKKDCAMTAVAQLELKMEKEDAQAEVHARRPPGPASKKVRTGYERRPMIQTSRKGM